jgi:hypothetical protein
MRKHRSLGEMISTATFVGCGLFILLHSMELLDNGENLRGYIGIAAGSFCSLGGFRVAIANLVTKWRGD